VGDEIENQNDFKLNI